MRFWDSSALRSLIAEELPGSELAPLLQADPATVIWWGPRVELESGVCQRHREGQLGDSQQAALLAKIGELVNEVTVVQPKDHVVSIAVRLLRVHPLRAADALQLAAAIALTENDPAGIGFVCLDRRLREAAAREGFHIIPE